MKKLYCLHTLYDFYRGTRTVLNYEFGGMFAINNYYVRYKAPEEHSVYINLSLNKTTGFPSQIIFLLSGEFILCRNDIDLSCYPSLKSTIYLASNEPMPPKDSYTVITISQPMKSYLYDNALLIEFAARNKSQFLFQDCENFGILTDKDFVVTGFVVLSFNAEDQEVLKEQKPSLSIKLETCEPFAPKERMFVMYDKQFLINKILELQNVSFTDLIYFGYVKQIIDEEFVIDFATGYIMQKNTDEFLWVDLSSTDPQKRDPLATIEESVLAKLEKKIQNPSKVLTEQMPFFNKVWFYLFSVSTIKELNLIG